MRYLGIALAVASLALSAGGVTVRPAAADEAAPAAQSADRAPVVEYASGAEPAAPNSCQRSNPGPYVVHLTVDRPSPAQFVDLNTRGYNYAMPDDPPERFMPSTAGPRKQP
jgi:hypothetical protein